VVVVVHPGLSLQVLVLPPWLVVVVVTNPFLFPFVLSARAALETSEPTRTRTEIRRVMDFLLFR